MFVASVFHVSVVMMQMCGVACVFSVVGCVVLVLHGRVVCTCYVLLCVIAGAPCNNMQLYGVMCVLLLFVP